MEKFIKFLEDNNAWENFERNFIEQGGGVERYKRDCKTLERSHLSIAFIWSKTEEGHEYWEKLSSKWRKGHEYRGKLSSKWREESTPLKEQLLSKD